MVPMDVQAGEPFLSLIMRTAWRIHEKKMAAGMIQYDASPRLDPREKPMAGSVRKRDVKTKARSKGEVVSLRKAMVSLDAEGGVSCYK